MLAQYPTDYPLSLTFNGFRGDIYDAKTGIIKFLGGSCLQGLTASWAWHHNFEEEHSGFLQSSN